MKSRTENRETEINRGKLSEGRRVMAGSRTRPSPLSLEPVTDGLGSSSTIIIIINIIIINTIIIRCSKVGLVC